MTGAPPRVAGTAERVLFAGAGGKVGARALERLAAVGLLRRSSVSFDAVCFRVGTAGPESPPFARARDAAVGAKSPEPGFGGLGDVVVDAEGVLGRELDGVLGRVLDGVFGLTLDGVFGRDGVTDAREDGRDREGVDFGKLGALIEVVDMPGWNDEGGDFAGVREGGFVLVVLGLLSRVFDGVAGVRAVTVGCRPADAAGLLAGADFFGGDDGGSGERTL